jgi:hypothetical protein
MHSPALLSLAASLLLLPHSLAAASFTAPQPKTADAVKAADDNWEKAEERGDVAYVDDLLMPGYRSVNADGTVHDKAAILANARNNLGSAEHAEKVAKWLAAHPMGSSVLIQGDTAVVTFYSKPLGPEKGIMSSDIFTYVDGRWHAIYSQHTQVGR